MDDFKVGGEEESQILHLPRPVAAYDALFS